MPTVKFSSCSRHRGFTTDKLNCHWLHWNNSAIFLCLGTSTFLRKTDIYGFGDREIQFFSALLHIILVKQTPNKQHPSLPKAAEREHPWNNPYKEKSLPVKQTGSGALLSAWATQGNRDTRRITIYTLNNKHISSTLDSLLLAQYLKQFQRKIFSWAHSPPEERVRDKHTPAVPLAAPCSSACHSGALVMSSIQNPKRINWKRRLS